MTDEPLVVLRAALRAGNPEAAARLLPRLPVAVAVRGDHPVTGFVEGQRALPVFLSMDSWTAFGSGDDVRLLDPAAFGDVVDQLAIDVVLFDPATSDAVTVPATDVRTLLRGEVVAKDGSVRLIGEVTFVANPELRAVLAEVITALGDVAPASVWAMWRMSGYTSTPTIAVADDLPEPAVQRLLDGVRARPDLPRDVEVIPLSASDTARARVEWGAHVADAARPQGPSVGGDR